MQRNIIAITAGLFAVLGGIGIISLSREYAARLILGSSHKATVQQVSAPKQKTVHLYYPKHNGVQETEIKLPWGMTLASNAHTLVSALLTLLGREHVLAPTPRLQSVSFVESGGILLLSFEHSLLTSSLSIKHKWQLVECLLCTLHQSQIPVNIVHNFLESLFR